MASAWLGFLSHYLAKQRKSAYEPPHQTVASSLMKHLLTVLWRLKCIHHMFKNSYVWH